MSVITRAWGLYQEQGLSGLRRRVTHSVWNCRKYIVFRKDMGTGECPCKSSGIGFRVATSEDLPWICDQMSHLGNHAENILSQQFCQGDMTVIGVSEDHRQELVFSLWLSRKDFGLKLLNDDARAEDVSIRRVWVRPTRRRMGLAQKGLSFAEYAAKEAGISKIWSFVLENNVPSRRLHEKMGYEDFGRIRFVKKLRKRFVRTRTIEKRKWTVRELPEGVFRL